MDYQERNKEMLVMRQHGYNLKQIGSRFGISGERTRQIVRNQLGYELFKVPASLEHERLLIDDYTCVMCRSRAWTVIPMNIEADVTIDNIGTVCFKDRQKILQCLSEELRPKKTRVCPVCNRDFIALRKYCSRVCFSNRPKAVRIVPTEKICTKCKLLKPIESYYKHLSKYYSYCKKCHSNYRYTGQNDWHKTDRAKLWRKQYWLDNRDRLLQLSRDRYRLKKIKNTL